MFDTRAERGCIYPPSFLKDLQHSNKQHSQTKLRVQNDTAFYPAQARAFRNTGER